MPVDVGAVLEGLKIGEARRQAAIVNKLAQQRADQQHEEAQARLDLEREAHQQQTEHQKALLKASEAVYNLHRLKTLQEIGTDYQKGAPVPAGLNLTPGEDGTATITDPNNVQDQQIPGVIGNVPLPTSMQVTQPDTFAAQQAARQEVTEAPKRATQAALQAEELKRQLATAAQREAADAERARLDRESREKIAGDAAKARVMSATITANRAASTNQQTARADRSYNTTITQLGKLEMPVSDSLARIGKLQDTINFASPATDPLVAPELLTIMAGGPQSGLRMSEAEIARIVGGRNNFQSLKSTLDKWSSDPSKPFLLTPTQRQQTKALVQTVSDRLRAKQQILTQTRMGLINAESPDEHRRVLADAMTKLQELDAPQMVKIKAPDGSIAEFPPDVAAHYIKLGATEVK